MSATKTNCRYDWMTPDEAANEFLEGEVVWVSDGTCSPFIYWWGKWLRDVAQKRGWRLTRALAPLTPTALAACLFIAGAVGCEPPGPGTSAYAAVLDDRNFCEERLRFVLENAEVEHLKTAAERRECEAEKFELIHRLAVCESQAPSVDEKG